MQGEGEGGFSAREIFWEEKVWFWFKLVPVLRPERAGRSLLFEGLFEASTFPPCGKGMGESEEEEKGGIGAFLLKEFRGSIS